MSKVKFSSGREEEVIAAALNEQGYLLQNRVASEIAGSIGEGVGKHRWAIEASEFPVSINGDFETRIDLVLCHIPNKQCRVIIECKRASPDFKQWVFFGRGIAGQGYSIERIFLNGMWDRREAPPLRHTVQQHPMDEGFPIYEFGLEARAKPAGQQSRSSATNAIQDALRQVTHGQGGLAFRLKQSGDVHFTFIPVVVTTAKLMAANFSPEKISLIDGVVDVEDLDLKPTRWVAVDARVSDWLCDCANVDYRPTPNLADDLAGRLNRTVFVVQAEHISVFLVWLEGTLGYAKK